MRAQLRPIYSHMGRPSVDPELIVRMLVIGYGMGIRSERRLCQDVHLNLAYRWFCRLGLDGKVPDHSTFSKYRHGKFRESNLLRRVFEATVERCLKENLVSGEGFAVDASLIPADANKTRSLPASGVELRGRPQGRSRGRRASISRRWTMRHSAPRHRRSRSSWRSPIRQPSGPAPRKAGPTSPTPTILIDTKCSVIMDVEATRAIRQAKVGASQTMLDRTEERLASGPTGSPPTPPTARARTSAGWSSSAGSSRSSR